MKTLASDHRNRQLQKDLIDALPTEKLLRLEQECLEVCRSALRRRRFLELAFLGACFVMAFLQKKHPDNYFVYWCIIGVVVLVSVIIRKYADDALWALQFSNGKDKPFCLPLWLKGRDDPQLFRAWRAHAGGECEVKPVAQPLLKRMRIRYRVGHGLSAVLSWAVLWGLAAAFVFGRPVPPRPADEPLPEYISPGVPTSFTKYVVFPIRKHREDIGKFGMGWPFLPHLIATVMGVLVIRWWYMKLNPDAHGEGYKDIVATLDTRGGREGARRQR